MIEAPVDVPLRLPWCVLKKLAVLAYMSNKTLNEMINEILNKQVKGD